MSLVTHFRQQETNQLTGVSQDPQSNQWIPVVDFEGVPGHLV
jgi:hypothetical protein